MTKADGTQELGGLKYEMHTAPSIHMHTMFSRRTNAAAYSIPGSLLSSKKHPYRGWNTLADGFL